MLSHLLQLHKKGGKFVLRALELQKPVGNRRYSSNEDYQTVPVLANSNLVTHSLYIGVIFLHYRYHCIGSGGTLLTLQVRRRYVRYLGAPRPFFM
jgi:hypothetical protein